MIAELLHGNPFDDPALLPGTVEMERGGGCKWG